MNPSHNYHPKVNKEQMIVCSKVQVSPNISLSKSGSIPEEDAKNASGEGSSVMRESPAVGIVPT